MSRSQQQRAMGLAVVMTILVIKLLILGAIFGWF